MSSILNALKQVENDCPDQGDENRPSFNFRNTLSSQELKKRSSLFRPGSFVGLVALVVSMAIVSYSLLFINNNIQSQTPNAVRKSQIIDTQPDIARDQKQKIAGSVGKPSDLPEASIEILPKSAADVIDLSKLSNTTVLKPESVDKVPAGSAFSNKPKEKIMVPSDTNPLKKTKEMVPSKSADEAETISDDNALSIVEEATFGSSEKETQIKKDTPKQKILPLENKSLKIQAISWDEEPATRVAVINNSVLTEGDFVQDYRLVLIEKNSVILHYSGNDYRLEFKYR